MCKEFIDFDERVARYNAWRRREAVGRPMIGILWEPDIPPLEDFLSGVGKNTAVRPQQIDPQRFLPHVERWHQEASRLPQDGFQRFTPAFGIPWMEAIAGCRVVATPGSLWAEPCCARLRDRPRVRFDPENPWFRKLIDFVRALVEHAGSRYPVAAPQFRGPLDILAAMRTPRGMCLDLLDEPGEVRAALLELTDLWIGVGRAVVDEIPSFQGGYMGRMGSWLPERAITMQNDISTLVSPAHYERFVLPLDERITTSFPGTEFHVHASEHRHIDNWLTLPDLDTIQFTLEHTLGGPSLEEMLAVVRRILRCKPLVLAALDLQTADRCSAELPYEGLYVTVAFSDATIPDAVAQWLETKVARVSDPCVHPSSRLSEP